MGMVGSSGGVGGAFETGARGSAGKAVKDMDGELRGEVQAGALSV